MLTRIFAVIAALGGVALAVTAGTDAAAAAASRTNVPIPETRYMKLRIKINDGVALATLNTTETARAFAALLPVTLKMKDLFRREKYAHLPKPLSENAPHTSRYEVGDIAYWSPSQDVAIYYRQDGETIPAPGVITIGRLDAGVGLFNVSGPATVTIEAAK